MKMRNIFGIAICTICCLIAGLLLAGCSTFGGNKTPPVTAAEIVQMSQAKVPSADIISKIRKSGTVYRMSASKLAELKSKGVNDKVINYMQQTYLNAVARDQRLKDSSYWNRWDDGCWYGGTPCGWSYDPLWYDDWPDDDDGYDRD